MAEDHSQFAMLFDMDGVLIDSYQAHFESWQVVAAEYGRTYSEEQFIAGFGRKSQELIREQWEGAADWPDEKVIELEVKKEDAFREILKRDFPAMPGARQLMADLHAEGFRIAVASSGPRVNVELVIDELNIREFLSASVTADDVTIGKPHPQVFLKAAEKAGVAPEFSCVVEDAPAGVAAAKAAGMVCFGFVQSSPLAQPLPEADVVVSQLDQITPANTAELIQNRTLTSPASS